MHRSTEQAPSTPLRSSVSRRIFGLFVACSLVPLSLLSLLSYWHISDALQEDAARRLRQFCKATGMTVFERLTVRDQDLETIAGRIRSRDRNAVKDAVEQIRDRVTDQFDGVALYSPAGELVSWIGEVPALPELSTRDLGHLQAGNPLLRTSGPAGQRRAILLLRRCPPVPDVGAPLLVARVRADQLWDGNGVLTSGADFVALDEQSQVIFATESEVPAAAAFAAGVGSSGRFDWDEAGGRHLARSWRLFMQPRFHATWTLIYSQPRDQIFATLYGFRRTFVLFTVLTFLIVMWVSVRQIRKRLMPIQRLLHATEQVGEQQFDCKVDIRTKDEFERLGEAFNTMVERLERYLKARNSAESELIAARDKALAAAQTEARFIANVSHELRTPMTSIRAFAEILKEHGADDPETRDEFLDIIVAESDRLTRLIENVLDLTKIRSMVEPKFEVIDVSQTVVEVCMAMRVVAADRKITIDDQGVTAPLWADGDRDCLKQVWTNLISNATKFSPVGGVITVRAYLDDDRIVVDVSDQGPGISEKDQTVIFERFRQVTSDVVTDKPSGTGLGLTIAKDIVGMHRGEIEVHSAPGKGSTFRVALPVSFHAAPPLEITAI